MRARWGGVVVAALLLAGCTVPGPEPTPSPTVTPIPADVQAFLAAASSGDIAAVRARLAVWNEAAGRNLKPDEISLECATDETAAVAAKVNDPALTAYVYTGGSGPWVVRFEAADRSSKGWGIELDEGGWFWQAQAESCQALWSSPSPSASE